MSLVAAHRKAYFPSFGSIPTSSPPIYGGSVSPFPVGFPWFWDDTSAADRIAGVWDTPSSTPFITRTNAWVFTSPGSAQRIFYVLLRQYVFPAFGAMDIQDPGGTGRLLSVSNAVTQPNNPIVRVQVTISPSLGSNAFAQTRMLMKVVDSGGGLKAVYEGSMTGSHLPTSGLTAKTFIFYDTNPISHYLPISTDSLVFEIGFALTSFATGTAVTYTISADLGDSASTYLLPGNTGQFNPGLTLGYWTTFVSAASANGGIISSPHPTLDPLRFQSPPVTDRQSSTLNEFLLNGQIL